ncbi:MAG TPA: hypothetical protein H9894_05385 [Candidatus Desulfovibrio intestinipullorum]|uniref:Uncharacterized protein n=1 Tax=Candidatus Desulfovibrio intestinipullorum TaxID=2838536 RepID=A0A9D1TQ03_9BACT|nr:hypothetical protein [Candidatus Desulfovibrio intestinipullorum]
MRPTQSIPSVLPGEAAGSGQVVRTSQAVQMSLPGLPDLNAEPRAGAAATSAARSEETAAAARAAARPQAEATGNTVSQAPARRPIYHLRPMGGRRGFRAAAHPDQRQDQRQEYGPDQRQNQAAAAVPAAESPSAATVPAAASAAGPGVRAAGPASAGTGIGTLSGTVPGVVVETGEEVSPEVLALAACDIPAELATGEEAVGALDRSFDFSDQAAVPIVPEGTTMVVEEDVVLTGSKRRSTRSTRTVQKKAARKPTRRKTTTGTTGTRRRTSTRAKAAAETAPEQSPEQNPDQMTARMTSHVPDPVVSANSDSAPSPAEGSGDGMTVAGYPDAAQDAAQETAFQPAFQEAARQTQAQAAIPRRPTFARDDEGQLRRLRQRLSAPYADSLFPELEAEEAARAARSRDDGPAESEDRGFAGRVPAAGAPVPGSTGPAGPTDEADHRERARTREPAADVGSGQSVNQSVNQSVDQSPEQTPAQATWAARADSRPQAAGPVSQEPASDRTASPEADVRSTEQGTDQSTDQAPEQPAEEAQAGQSAALRRRLPILSGCSHRLLIVLVLIVLGIGAIGMFLMQSQTDPRGPVTGRLPDRLTDRSRPSASVPADRNGTVPVTAPGLVPGTAAPDSYGLHGTQDADRPAGLTAQEWAEILSADEQNEDNSADDLGASRETSLEVSREAGQASEPLAAAEQGADDTSASSGDSADPAGRATAEEKARQMRQFALELRLLRLTTQDTMALLARVEEALGRQEDVSGDAGQPDTSGAREAAEADLIRLLDRCEILGVQMRQWALRSRALVLAEDEFSRELARRAARALAARAAQAPDTASTETASDAHTALLSGAALTAAAPAASSREPAGKAAGRAQSPQVLPEDDRNTQQKAPDSEQQTVQKETRKEARKDSAKADSGREVNRTKQEKKQKAQARTVREKKERARTNARAKAQAGKSVPLALRGWTVAGIGDNRAVLADPEGRAWTVVAGGRTTDFRVLAIDLAGHRVLTDKGPLSFAGSGTNRSGKKDFGKKDSGKKDSGRQGPGVN